MSDDQMQGAPTSTSDVPNQLPESSSAQPSLFQQAMQGAVQPAPAQQPATPQPDPKQAEQAVLEQHPANLQAKVLHKVAETLSGGPQYKTTYDPQTGEATREKLPMSGKQLMLASVANILGSIGQVSGNLSRRIEGQAPAAIQALPTQQAQQQRDTLSEEDYNRVQNQKIRTAKILQANMEALRTGYSMGKEEDSAKDAYVATHADELKDNQDSGNIQDSRVPSSEIPKRNYKLSDVTFVPDGRVPVYKDGQRVMKDGIPLSELTYSVVNGQRQTKLTPEDYAKFLKYGLMKPSGKQGDDFKLPDNAELSQATINRMNHQVGMIDQSNKEFQKINPDVNLLDEIKKNPKGVMSALEKWHNDASSTEPDTQLDQVRAKHPDAASTIEAIVGPEKFQQYKEARIAREATQKAQATKTGELAAETSPDVQQKVAQGAALKTKKKRKPEPKSSSRLHSNSMGSKLQPILQDGSQAPGRI